MYRIINEKADILIQQLYDSKHVKNYAALRARLRDVDVTSDEKFQRDYRGFWALNVARLDKKYLDAHFSYLDQHKASGRAPDVCDVAKYLLDFPTGTNEKKTLQFSFASKLVHMIDPSRPVYDGLVRQFYFLPDCSGDKDRGRQIRELGKSYNFLQNEYSRIMNNGLLDHAIGKFEEHFSTVTLTRAKIIDSLIWGFTVWLNNGAIRKGEVEYE